MDEESLLDKVAAIVQKYEAQTRDREFNLLSIIRQESKELMHSNFIAELLDPKGAHRQECKFLVEFFKTVLPKLDAEIYSTNVSIEREEYIGDVILNNGNAKRGFIDICIKYGDKIIAIENKIGTEDHDNQLEKYIKHVRKYMGEESPTIYYLTLDGRLPHHFVQHGKVVCLSYREHILEWLKKCVQIENLPLLVKTNIEQYLEIVKQLTNQTDMEREIKELIVNEEYKTAAYNIAEALDHMRQECKEVFYNQVKSELLQLPYGTVKEERGDKRNEKHLKIEIFSDDKVVIHWVAGIKDDFYALFTINDKSNGGEVEPTIKADYLDRIKEIILPHYKDDTRGHILGFYGKQHDIDFKKFENLENQSDVIEDFKAVIEKVKEKLNSIQQDS